MEHAPRSTQAAISYSYDANKPNRLNSVSGGLVASYAYDSNGNMISGNTKGTFTYDYRNLPIAMALNNATGGGTVDLQNQTISGTYTNSAGDSVHLKDITISAGSNVTIESKNGMRIEAGFSSNGATVNLKPGVPTAGGGGSGGGSGYNGTIYATYDGNANRIKYLKGSTSNPQDGSVISVYGANGQLICDYKRSGGVWTADYFEIRGNDLIGYLDASTNTRRYKISDHIGSSRVTLTQSGSVDSWITYFPHGKIAQEWGNTLAYKEKFSGKKFDQASGYIDFGWRTYNPDIVRWLSVDPLKEKHPDWNPYNYVLGNPISLTDPDGRQVSYLLREGLNYLQQNTSSSTGQFFIGLAQGVVSATSDNITNLIDATQHFSNQVERLSEGDLGGAMMESQLVKTVEGAGQLGAKAFSGDANAVGQVVGMAGVGIAVGKAAGGTKAAGAGPATYLEKMSKAGTEMDTPGLLKKGTVKNFDDVALGAHFIDVVDETGKIGNKVRLVGPEEVTGGAVGDMMNKKTSKTNNTVPSPPKNEKKPE